MSVPSGNPINKVVFGSATLVDLTPTTAEAGDVADGKVFFNKEGVYTVGTASGGGGSSYTLLASQDFTANTTNTSQVILGEVPLEYSDVYTSGRVIYVKIRDKAGPRNGFFVGYDSYFFNPIEANGRTSGDVVDAAVMAHRKTANGAFLEFGAGTATVCGVFATGLYVYNGNSAVEIACKYDAQLSLTINGTYSVEVYALDYAPNGNPYNYSY